MQHKITHFVLRIDSFFLNTYPLILIFLWLSHCRENIRCKDRLKEGVCMVGVGIFTPLEWNEVFLEVSFARQFKTPDEISCRVLGVWVLPIATYFIFCPYFLNTLICRFPFGYQIIFISRNGNFLFVTTWILSSFVGRGGFISFINLLRWLGVVGFLLPCPLFAANKLTNFLCLVHSSLPLTVPDRHIDICCGRFPVRRVFDFLKQKDKTRLKRKANSYPPTANHSSFFFPVWYL